MPLPIPNLDDKTFDQLVDEAKRRIPVYAPRWTDHNVHDPGITFIELFAWLAEMQLYSLNRIGERNYLKYLKLLGIIPAPATAARADVAFSSDVIKSVKKLTRVAAEDIQTGDKVTFETDEEIEVLPVALKRIASFAGYKFTEVTEFNEPDKDFFYAFGEKAESGSALYLGLDFDRDALAGKELRLGFYLYERDLPPPGRHGNENPSVYPSAEASWEYWNGTAWVALNLSADELVKALVLGGRVSFTLESDFEKSKQASIEEELFWVRCRVTNGSYEIPPRIDRVMLNMVSATEGITVEDDVAGSSSGLPDQTFTASYFPIIAGSQVVTVKGEEWHAVDDFDASGPEDNHYIIEPDKGTITFGDGVQGRIPSEGEEIKLTYRYGGGEKGNVKAGALTKVYDRDSDLIEILVTNPFPASGGSKAENVQETILRARKELKTPVRAVTADDFEYVALSTPGLRVARAKAIVMKKNEVTVVVVPYSLLEKATPSDGFLHTVLEHLDKHRLITTCVKVEKPDYVRVSVNASIKIKPGYEPAAVSSRAEKVLDGFLSPLKGGPDGADWPFGRSVYRSEVYEVIEGVDGVDCVMKLTIAGVAGDLDIGDLSLVYPGRHTIEIIEPETICREQGCER